MSDTITLSFLDAMSAVWKPESCDVVEQAIRATLGTVRDTDVRVVSSLNVPGGRGLFVSLIVFTSDDRSTGLALQLERTWLGLRARALDYPTIPESLLSARVKVQPSWLADA